MDNVWDPIASTDRFRLSNPSVLCCTALKASLEIFGQTEMSVLHERSQALTGFLSRTLTKSRHYGSKFKILTPELPHRAAQLSLLLAEGVGLTSILSRLHEGGCVVDERKPNVIRIAPTALYNTFADCWHFCNVFDSALSGAV
jgi:kynureninase